MTKSGKMKAKTASRQDRMRLPRKEASFAELADFFDRHDAAELVEQGVMEVDPDCASWIRVPKPL